MGCLQGRSSAEVPVAPVRAGRRGNHALWLNAAGSVDFGVSRTMGPVRTREPNSPGPRRHRSRAPASRRGAGWDSTRPGIEREIAVVRGDDGTRTHDPLLAKQVL